MIAHGSFAADTQQMRMLAAFRAKARAWLQANAPRELLPTLEKVAYGDAILETPVVIHASKP